MAGNELNIPKQLAAAEELLHLGQGPQAREAAASVLHAAATPSEVSRALFVLLQADYQEQRVHSLETTSREFNRTLENLPVTAVLLWGVIAIDAGHSHMAREVLHKFIAANCELGASSLSREDAMALSRLYGVNLLAAATGDYDAARDWLTGGGAGLAPDQLQMLLAEVEAAQARRLTPSASPGPGPGPGPSSIEAAGARAGAGWPPSGASDSWGAPQGSEYVTMTGEVVGQPGGGYGAGEGAGPPSGLPPEEGPLAQAREWVRGQASAWWNSRLVQGTLQSLHMEELEPWQLAVGAGAVALLAYAAYDQRAALRRGGRRAALSVAAGVAHAGAMVMGGGPNPMAAAPAARERG